MSKQFAVSSGHPLPIGPSILSDAVNFSLFSRHATQVSLLLYESSQKKAVAEIPLDPIRNRTGDLWHISVAKLDLKYLYAFRLDGPNDPKGSGPSPQWPSAARLQRRIGLPVLDGNVLRGDAGRIPENGSDASWSLFLSGSDDAEAQLHPTV